MNHSHRPSRLFNHLVRVTAHQFRDIAFLGGFRARDPSNGAVIALTVFCSTSMSRAGDSVVLEEEVDPSYEPTEEEIIEYAKWLGFDVDEGGSLQRKRRRTRRRL